VRVRSRYGTAFVGLVVGFAAVVGLGALLGLRLNLTESLPRGVYRTITEEAVRGSIVVVCLPLGAAELARARGYLGPGSCPGGVRGVGKIVLATGGDMVAHREGGITVNGRPIAHSRTLARDSRQRALPHHAWGDYVLEARELWLFSPYRPNSYDSRYFGPVYASDVVSVLRPVWTWARPPTSD
jgi:conjugative transfer signal peptidase TraF